MGRQLDETEGLLDADGDLGLHDDREELSTRHTGRDVPGKRGDMRLLRRRVEELQEQRMLRNLLSDLDADYPDP